MTQPAYKAALIAAVLAVGAMGLTTQSMAAQQVSAAVAKQLDAANKAVKAQKWDEAVVKLREVQGISGRTPHDTYVMNQLLSYALFRQNKFADAITALESNLRSGLASTSEKNQINKQLLPMYYGQKNYAKTIEIGQTLIAAGAADDGTYSAISQSYEKQGKLGEAIKFVKERLAASAARGAKPSENDLLLLLDYQRRLKDDKGEADTFQRLVSYYPKSDYWLNIIQSIKNAPGNSDQLTLQIFRLMRSTNTLTRPADITEMAQLAKEQNSAGEALGVLDQAIKAKVFTEEREQASSGRLMASLTKQVADDRAKIEAEAGAAKTGDQLVVVGQRYYGLAEYDKAVDALKRGITAGGLTVTTPEDAQMLIGIAQLRAQKNADAAAAFKAVKGNPKFVKLANLWGIIAG
ncbi:MAG: hypothetical protein ABIT36_13410 [Steroidobacteraceae bacterium]